MYSSKTGLILGFHGCDQSVCNSVINQSQELKPSNNIYDWLGNGIYFWENNYQRALDYAQSLAQYPLPNKKPIKNAAVIGAVIDLGHCLDLLDSKYLQVVKVGYDLLLKTTEISRLPINKKPLAEESDLLLRDLDCAVIEIIHTIHKEMKEREYDSVRGVFWEGKELYPHAGFREKNHIQICVRNPNCIKGFFLPRSIDSKYQSV